MPDAPLAWIAGLWLCWAAFWTVAAIGAKASARREPMRSRLLHLVPLALAVVLLWGPAPGRRGCRRASSTPRAGRPGPALRSSPPACSSRSGRASISARTGAASSRSSTTTSSSPAGRTRSSATRSTAGSCSPSSARRSPTANGAACVAVVVVAAAFWRKLRLEERWMGEHFGAAYERYRRRVSGARALRL